MIFDRTLMYSLCNPYSVYVRMVEKIQGLLQQLEWSIAAAEGLSCTRTG